MGYKLLTKEMKSRQGWYNEMDWSDVGEWHEATGHGGLCTEGVLHDYDDPWIAAVMNPAHAKIADPVMYETERGGDVETDGLKCGSKRLRLTRQVDIPDVPLVQRVAFGIFASLRAYRCPDYLVWAGKWLSGEDRSATSAVRAAGLAGPDLAISAAAYAAEAASCSAAVAAAYAAEATSCNAAVAAAYADAGDEGVGFDATIACAARNAVRATRNAARAAAEAAAEIAWNERGIDWAEIAVAARQIV